MFQNMGKRKAHQMSDGESDTETVAAAAETPKTKKRKGQAEENFSALISIDDLDPDDEIWIVKLPSHVRNLND